MSPWENVIDVSNVRRAPLLVVGTGIILPRATSSFISNISSIPDMSFSPSASDSFSLLYNSALQDYATQTGTSLVDHPFAKRLEKCESLDSISSLLQENVRRFGEFRKEDGKIVKSLKCAVHVLHTLSTSAVLGEGIGLVRPEPVYISHFVISDAHPVAIPTCKGGICRIRNLTRGKCVSCKCLITTSF